MDLFEDIDFPQIFILDDEKPKLFDESLKKYLEKETFKENICSSLKNMIDFEKFLENQDEKRHSILREQRIECIKKIDNLENFLVIINGYYCEIYDNNGSLILDRFRPSAHDIIEVSTNLILTILDFGIIFLISFESGKEKDMLDRSGNFISNGKGKGGRQRDSNSPREIRVIRAKSEQNYIIKEKKIIFYQNNIILKVEWISKEKILTVLSENALYFYFINNINTFDFTDKKEFKYQKDLNINFHDLDENFSNLKMVYNSYNFTLIISFLEYIEDKEEAILHLYIFDIKSLSIIKQFDIKNKQIYEEYYLIVLNEFTLLILFVSGLIYNISLKYYQLETIIEAFDKNEIDFNSEIKINVFDFQNKKKFLIFNNLCIKLFGFNPPYEIIEENINDEKYKYLELDKFNKKKYCFNYIQSLNDSGKYVIGYSQFYQFFRNKCFFKTHIKIVNK